jgi:hypothetical protein
MMQDARALTASRAFVLHQDILGDLRYDGRIYRVGEAPATIYARNLEVVDPTLDQATVRERRGVSCPFVGGQGPPSREWTREDQRCAGKPCRPKALK